MAACRVQSSGDQRNFDVSDDAVIKPWRNPGFLGVGKRRSYGPFDHFRERFSTRPFEAFGKFVPDLLANDVVARLLTKLMMDKLLADHLV